MREGSSESSEQRKTHLRQDKELGVALNVQLCSRRGSENPRGIIAPLKALNKGRCIYQDEDPHSADVSWCGIFTDSSNTVSIARQDKRIPRCIPTNNMDLAVLTYSK